MHSTGNDIVSLNAINITRTLQPRFYTKILAAAEIAAYDQYKNNITFENFVWLSWSIKESAYKFLQRNNPSLVFSPTKFIVTRLEIPANNSPSLMEGNDFTSQPVYKSTVIFGSETLYSRSIVNSDFIFSVVNEDNNFEDTGWGVKRINDANSSNQSTEVRTFLLAKLKSDLSSNNLQINKNKNGCPILMYEDVEIPISLAHHGHWVGYSYQTTEALLQFSS